MLESSVQTKIIKSLIADGWFVRKIIQTNCPGDPDLYLYKAGRVVWIEAKRPGKEAEPLQEYRHREIISAGMECYTVDNYDSFLLLGLISTVPVKKSRCCGRCDGVWGVLDICVADMVCEPHRVEGCEICYRERGK